MPTQMNPNNDAYWESRGYDERPDDWEEENSEREGDFRKNPGFRVEEPAIEEVEHLP